jgi:hypothetical protein
MENWKPQQGVDQDRANKFQQGMQDRMNDNPVMNAYKWLMGKPKAVASNDDDGTAGTRGAPPADNE